MPPTRLTVSTELPGVEVTEEERFLKMLVFGHPGAGKTRLCLSFCQEPRASPALWLDATGGTTGIISQARAAGARIFPVGDTDEVLKYTEWLLANKGGGFRTLIVDDFSECFSRTKEKVSKSFGHAGAEELEPKEHPKLYEKALKVYRAIKRVASPVATGGAGMHVLLTCWAENKPDLEKVERWVPKFAGQFGYLTPAYFDIVAYLEATITKEKTSKAITFTNELLTKSNRHLVRDRFDLLSGSMTMPTAGALLAALKNEHDSAVFNAQLERIAREKASNDN